MNSKSSPSGDKAPFFVDNEVITLTSQGLWFSDGTEITHGQTCRLFSKILHQDWGSLTTPSYWLLLGQEKKQVVVQDTPFFVKRIDGSPETGFTVTLNDDWQEPLDPTQLKYRPGRLTYRSSAHQERGFKEGFEAKFLSTPYFELLKNLEESASEYFLSLAGPNNTVKRVVLAHKE